MTRFRSAAGVLLAGIGLAFAFPEPDIAPLAWIAIAPLLAAGKVVSARTAFLLGLLFGLGFFGALLYWVSIVGWIAWGVLVLMSSLFIGAFSTLWSATAKRLPLWARVATAASLWVLVEYARMRIPVVGFTWGQIAQSQHNAAWILRTTGFAGSWAVAFLLVAVNCLLAEAWTSARRSGAVRPAVLASVTAVALLVAPVLIPASNADGKAIRVAIVQGNVPRDFEGPVLDKELQIIASHERLTKELSTEAGSIDLVVWPESSLGLDIDNDPSAAGSVGSAARAIDAPLIVGGNLDAGPDRYKVMAFHVAPDGTVVDRYQKTHLVPFGEYVPARSLLDWLPMLDQVPRDAIAGGEEAVFSVAGGRVAPVISFEGDFGSLVRRRIDGGGRLLVVATNTSTWEDSWASAQHLAFSQVRAAENGVWVVHAALSGISAFVAPDGTVVESTELWRAMNATTELRFATGLTFYARTGDWLPVLCLLVMIVALGRAFASRRSDRNAAG
jgi:apolipoprotein N-acyltransferase